MSSVTSADVQMLDNTFRGAPAEGSDVTSEMISEQGRRGSEQPIVANVSEDGEKGRKEERTQESRGIHHSTMTEENTASTLRPKKISWKCGLCSYYVLAMDHNGNPLEFNKSPSGEPLPMSCPRCMLLHCDWEPAVPFDDFNNHANIRSKQSNSYVMNRHGLGKGSTFPPVRASAGKDSKLPSTDITRILQEVKDRWKNYTPIPASTTREHGPKGRLMAYYCDKCNRELLRMDQYGELVPMGAATVLLGQPLDTAKTRTQAFGPLACRSAWGTMWNVVREEGARSLYRGMTPPLIMLATKRSLQFAMWDFIRSDKGCGGSLCAVPTTSGLLPNAYRQQVAEPWRSVSLWLRESPFRSGAVAGAVGTFIGCPLHVIKLRTQYSTRSETKNAWVCAANIFSNEGVRGYFHGFGYHILKDTCFAGCYLGLYDVSKQRLSAWHSSHTSVETSTAEKRLPSGWTFVAGCAASMVTWSLLYPLDTIKTIVQARCVGAPAVMKLLRGESLLAVYRGLGVSLLRAGPVSGISMVVYEAVKKHTDRWQWDRERARRGGESGA